MARVSGIYSGAGGQVALLSSDVEGGIVDSLPAARDEVAMELPPPPLASASCRYGTVKIEDLVWSRKNCNTLGNAEKTKISWSSTFIQKIHG